MLSGRSSFKQSAPAPALMDYNAGRPEPRALVLTLGIAAGAMLALFAPGAALMIICQPPAYGTWNGAIRMVSPMPTVSNAPNRLPTVGKA